MILLKDISYLVRNPCRVEQDVDLLIEGNRIKRIGRLNTRVPSKNITVLNCRGKAVIPGLVNAHTHLYQSMLKGRRDDLALVTWCEQITFPFVRAVLKQVRCDGSDEAGYLWSMLGAIEMIRNGITSFIDMDVNLDSVPKAWADIGIRGVAAMSMVDQWVPDDLMVSLEQTKENALTLIENWHMPPRKDPLIQVFLGPSAPFTCSEPLLSWILETAENYDLGIQTHVSETVWEVKQSFQSTGKSPLTYLESIGLLSRPITAVHCIHLTDQEIELAKGRNVIVVYNPKSNMKLASGIAPIVKMRQAGVEVALGTDGPASNDIMDLFEEMRAGALLQKVDRGDPAVLGARDVFRMATEAGAKACRVDAGMIDEGKLADLVVIDLSAPHLFTLGDEIVSALVYCAKGGDVETVIINGRLVLQDRKLLTIDEETILKEAKKAGEKLCVAM